MEPTMAGKWLELLKEIAPSVKRVAFLFNPATATYAEYYLKPFKAAAASLAVEAIAGPIRDTSELESVVTAQARERNGGLIVMPDSSMNVLRVEITSLAARYRLPAVYPYRFFTELGGLLSYGSDLPDNFRRAATYADRILKGAKPSKLPVQAPIKFELIGKPAESPCQAVAGAGRGCSILQWSTGARDYFLSIGANDQRAGRGGMH
jgi:putative ABC transport system substrate-binding protein